MDVPKLGQLTLEQEALFRKLTKLQKGFAEHYINGASATEAHRLGGGKCKNEKNRPTLAHEILNNPNVKAFIDSVEKKIIEEVQTSKIMSRQEMLERLSSMARVTVHDVGTVHSVEIQGADGEAYTQHIMTMKDMDEMSEAGKIALSGFTVTKSGLLIPQLHDPKAAMKQISDLLGYNRVEEGNSIELTQEERVLNMVKTHAVTDEKLD